MAATRTKVVIPNTNFYNINNTMDSTNGYFKYGGEAPVNSVVGNVNTPTIINMTIGQTQKSVINGREVYNLFEEDFDTLWQGRPWRDFRTAFQIRQDFYEEVYAGIDNCSEGRRRLMEAPGMLATFFSEHPPPSPCQACAKMRGL